MTFSKSLFERCRHWPLLWVLTIISGYGTLFRNRFEIAEKPLLLVSYFSIWLTTAYFSYGFDEQ